MLPESSETLDNAWGDLVPWGSFLCSFGFLLVRERVKEERNGLRMPRERSAIFSIAHVMRQQLYPFSSIAKDANPCSRNLIFGV